jgi:3-oxoacyl-[acyl-carrier protein] reductase
VVTGAAHGIGRAVAGRLAAEGFGVAMIDVDGPSLDRVAEEIAARGGSARSLPTDVSAEPEVERAFAAAADGPGPITAVVGVAGIELWTSGDRRVHELELAVWQRTLDVNLTGMFLTCKHGVRALRAAGGGALVVTGSPTGLFGFAAGETAYSASKAGVHGLARVVSTDYAAEGIRTNVVVPGFTATRVNRPVMDDPVALGQALATIPMGRLGRADEVAAMVAWLVSDEAGYCTGGFFFCDGGQTSI